MPVTRASLLDRLRHPTKAEARTQKTILLTSATCADMEEAAIKIEQLQAENDRLRAALSKIANRYPCASADTMAGVARDALGAHEQREATAPFDNEQDAAEAADNGRNTGGKSYR